MALPRNVETERGIALRKIVDDCADGEVFQWPDPRKEDCAKFGEIVWLFAGMDFVLRMTAEVMDDGGMLQDPYRGKVRTFSIKKTTDAIMSSIIWTGPNRGALERINELRRLRNLVAHFVAKRFVHEDAFVFMTKSAADFEQVYGQRPGANYMLYGVIDATQVHGAPLEITRLLRWAEKLPRDLSHPIEPH